MEAAEIDAMVGEDEWGMGSPDRGLLAEMYPEGSPGDDEFEDLQSPGSGNGVQELSAIDSPQDHDEELELQDALDRVHAGPHDLSIPLGSDVYLEDLHDDHDDVGSDSTVPVGDRLYLKGQEMVRKKEERAMKAQHDREEAEQTKNTGRPSICNHAVKRSGGDPALFYKLQTEWLRNKNRVLENKRDKEKKEVETMNREQHASHRSRRILAGKHKGPIEGWGEREQQFRAVHAERTNAGSFMPTISPAAQHLKRKGQVSDRLYGVAKQKAQEKTQTPREPSKKITKEGMDSLLHKMKLRQETSKRNIERKRVQLEQEEGKFQPEVNKRSEKILSRQGGHVPIHIRSKTQKQLSQSPEPSPQSVKKAIAPLQESFFNKMKTTKQKHEARMRSLQEKQASEMMRECHFRPETNKKSHELASRRDTRAASQSLPADWEAEEEEEPVYVSGGYNAQEYIQEPYIEETQERYESTEREGSPPARHDENFAQWEVEWVSQQRDIEAILKLYTTSGNQHKRDVSPQHTPATPAVSYSRPSPPRQPTRQQNTPPAPCTTDQVLELQSVLDGWRQLEDQFSTSFEKLRLR